MRWYHLKNVHEFWSWMAMPLGSSLQFCWKFHAFPMQFFRSHNSKTWSFHMGSNFSCILLIYFKFSHLMSNPFPLSSLQALVLLFSTWCVLLVRLFMEKPWAISHIISAWLFCPSSPYWNQLSPPELTSLCHSPVCICSLGVLHDVFVLIKHISYCSFVLFEGSFKSLSFESTPMRLVHFGG